MDKIESDRCINISGIKTKSETRICIKETRETRPKLKDSMHRLSLDRIFSIFKFSSIDHKTRGSNISVLDSEITLRDSRPILSTSTSKSLSSSSINLTKSSSEYKTNRLECLHEDPTTINSDTHNIPKRSFTSRQKGSKPFARSVSSEFRTEKEQVQEHFKNHTHHIIETSKIYSKKETKNSVMSPTGQVEESQGKVNQYHLFENIGFGAFGRVVLARDENTQESFACKIISKSRLAKKYMFSPTSNENVKREVAVLKKVSNHPKIIKLYEVLDDELEDNLYLCL